MRKNFSNRELEPDWLPPFRHLQQREVLVEMDNMTCTHFAWQAYLHSQVSSSGSSSHPIFEALKIHECPLSGESPVLERTHWRWGERSVHSLNTTLPDQFFHMTGAFPLRNLSFRWMRNVNANRAAGKPCSSLGSAWIWWWMCWQSAQ